MIYIIDYLTFSIKETSLTDIINLLNLSSVSDEMIVVKGFNGYTNSMYYNHINILFSEDRNNICINMSGQGCRTFESVSMMKWQDLFNILINNTDVNVTRLDVACDDKENIIDLKKMQKMTNDFINGSREHIATRFAYMGANYTTAGLTINYGSPKSDVQIMFYDKGAERGFDKSVSWTRAEIQLRDTLALNCIKELVKNDTGAVFCGILRNYLNFVKNKSLDTHNKSRCELQTWWRNFLREAEKVKIYSHVGMDYNLKNVENYLQNQVSNSLSVYIRCIGDESSAVKNILTSNTKYNRKQTDLITKYEYLQNKEKERLKGITND